MINGNHTEWHLRPQALTLCPTSVHLVVSEMLATKVETEGAGRKVEMC